MSQANVTGEASYFPPSGSLAHPMNDSLANTSLSDSATLQPWPLLRKSTILVVILSVAYILVFVLGVVNNSFVVSVIYRTPQMRNVTNYFLANLAIADLTVSFIVLPITLLNNLFTGRCLLYPTRVTNVKHCFSFTFAVSIACGSPRYC